MPHSSPPMHTPRRRRGPLLGVGAAVIAGLIVLPALPAMAAPAPGYLNDPNAAPGSFDSQNIAADRTDQNFFYRIPALAYLGDGVVLAAHDARPGGAGDSPNPNSIMQRRSTDNGKTWGPAQIIAAGHLGDATGPKYGYSDPSYVVDAQAGKVFAFFVYSKDAGFASSVYGNDDADRNVISSAVIESDDGGETWSTPRLITSVTKTSKGAVVNGAYQPVPGDVLSNFAASGEGIQLRYGAHAGRLVQQYSGRIRQADGSTLFQAYSVFSDDHGASWQRGQAVGSTMDENKVVELSDGRLMLNSRDSSNGRTRFVSISTDGGQSWGPVSRETEQPDPTNNASITRLYPDAAEGSADAKKLLFTNSNNGADGNRVNGAARVSCDDGATWPGLRTIDPGFFAYSTATRIGDGRIGVFWERSYTNDMQFSSFDDAWLNYVCAPLSTTEQNLVPGTAANVPITVTNQEATALSGTLSFYTPNGWIAGDAAVTDLAPGASTTVSVPLTAPTGAEGTQKLQAAFTATDGRISQFTATFQLPQPVNLGLTLTATNTSPARDVIANPYRAGDELSFTVRVTSTATVPTLVTPTASNFSSGFSPTACRWNNLPAKGAYNCTTPKHVITDEDVARGWYAPQFTFTVAPMSDTSAAVPVSFTGAAVPLRDGLLGATIVGSRTDASRDLATQPYAAGEQVPYQFRVDSTAPITQTVVPTAGEFAPFLPPGPGNCRYTNLAAGAGYTCATPRHTVTPTEAEQGFFVPVTTWTVSASGQTSVDYRIGGGEVDLAVRAPQLGGTVTGSWQDVHGNGYASIGDTVTFRYEIANTGNVRLDAVSAGDIQNGTLAVGATATAKTEVITLTGAQVDAGSVTPAPLKATATNGSKTVSAEITGEPFALTAKPLPTAWSATTTYRAGDRVSYNGKVYQALWWTRGQVPDATPLGAWAQIAQHADGTMIWTPSRIFTRGDVVEHNGTLYQAKWWTRNQTPGESIWGPWTRLGPYRP